MDYTNSHRMLLNPWDCKGRNEHGLSLPLDWPDPCKGKFGSGEAFNLNQGAKRLGQPLFYEVKVMEGEHLLNELIEKWKDRCYTLEDHRKPNSAENVALCADELKDTMLLIEAEEVVKK